MFNKAVLSSNGSSVSKELWDCLIIDTVPDCGTLSLRLPVGWRSYKLAPFLLFSRVERRHSL